MSDILATAEPFWLTGGNVGVLLVHGFTGTPKEMRPLGEALAGQGYTALGVRLTHHATRPEDMNRSLWADWFNSALDGYHLLRGACPTVFVVGLSMGGVLALRLGTHYPVQGVVCINPPSAPLMRSLGWRLYVMPWLRPVIPYLPKQVTPPAPDELPGHISYPVHPVAAVPQLSRLIDDTVAGLPRLTAPALVLASRHDQGVPPENAQYMYDRIGGANKTFTWLERGGHVVTRDCGRAALFEHVSAFLRAHLPAGARDAR